MFSATYSAWWCLSFNSNPTVPGHADMLRNNCIKACVAEHTVYGDSNSAISCKWEWHLKQTQESLEEQSVKKNIEHITSHKYSHSPHWSSSHSSFCIVITLCSSYTHRAMKINLMLLDVPIRLDQIFPRKNAIPSLLNSPSIHHLL